MSFPEEARRIYGPYPNGRDVGGVYGDPLRMYRRLVANCSGDLNQVIEEYNGPTDPKEREGARVQMDMAADTLREATAEALGLLQLDPKTGEGLTEDEVFLTLNSFLEWLEKNVRRAETCPTPGQSTAPETGPL